LPHFIILCRFFSTKLTWKYQAGQVSQVGHIRLRLGSSTALQNYRIPVLAPYYFGFFLSSKINFKLFELGIFYAVSIKKWKSMPMNEKRRQERAWNALTAPPRPLRISAQGWCSRADAPLSDLEQHRASQLSENIFQWKRLTAELDVILHSKV